jgi:BMFP domain-containing protein YqiC
MASDADSWKSPPSLGEVPRPTPRPNRVYNSDAVDEYVASLHDHAEALQRRIEELEAALTTVAPSAAPSVALPAAAPAVRKAAVTADATNAGHDDDVLVLARREAAELLETAREHAATVLAEGERLAARAVIRALEQIDLVVRGWAQAGDGPHIRSTGGIDLRDESASVRR